MNDCNWIEFKIQGKGDKITHFKMSELKLRIKKTISEVYKYINPLTARVFTGFGAWDATLLGTVLGVQDYKKVKFTGRDISFLAVKGLMYARMYAFGFISGPLF